MSRKRPYYCQVYVSPSRQAGSRRCLFAPARHHIQRISCRGISLPRWGLPKSGRSPPVASLRYRHRAHGGAIGLLPPLPLLLFLSEK